MTLFYRIAADAMVLLHMAYVLVVVLGLPAIWIGILFGHRWARNFWWRCGHLSMILIVVWETWAGITCPLTTWEQQLRELAQQETYSGDFIANHVHDWLFYDLPVWVFTMAYTGFGFLVLLSFLIAPPHWPNTRKPMTNES
jgi:hypothetical protein